MAILQAFAAMLEQPMAERVTTAALAKRLDVSEAALYRQFASKAQMLDALITFTEDSLLGLAGKVGSHRQHGLASGRLAPAVQGTQHLHGGRIMASGFQRRCSPLPIPGVNQGAGSSRGPKRASPDLPMSNELVL